MTIKQTQLAEAYIEDLGEQIAAAGIAVDRATHTLLTRIRAFDAAEGWQRFGMNSMEHWLGWRLGITKETAHQLVRTARALGALPKLDAALADGRVSYCKVRAVTRAATPESEAMWLEFAMQLTGAQLEKLVAQHNGVRATLDPAAPLLPPERWLRVRQLDDGFARIDVKLPADDAARILHALDEARRLAAEGRGEGADSSAGKKWPGAVEGLVLLAEAFLASPGLPEAKGPRQEVTVLVDEATLAGRAESPAVVDERLGVSAETARRLSCDAALVAVAVGAAGAVVDVGRRTRTVSAPMRRALWVRDRSCRFPGCTNRHYTDAHHVEHWARGGATELANLVRLCRFHHGLVHEGGFGCRAEGDGFAFTRPDGRLLDAIPPPPASLLFPAETYEAVSPAVRTTWDGVPYDHGLAIEALFSEPCFREPRPAAAGGVG